MYCVLRMQCRCHATFIYVVRTLYDHDFALKRRVDSTKTLQGISELYSLYSVDEWEREHETIRECALGAFADSVFPLVKC